MQDPARRALMLGLPALGLAACSRRLPALPFANHVYVNKTDRRMYLLRDTTALAVYDIQLGFEPLGHKQEFGDGRTPEGVYWVDRKNPNSSFHLSLGINYPNEEDIALAEARGVDPGGDIFIHGQPNKPYSKDDPDWTAGCIAVTNRQIEQIYDAVPVGTQVTILA